MHSLILSFLYLLSKSRLLNKIIKKNINLALIMITNGLSCVSCISSTNSGCNDPYDPNTSGDIPALYNTYCAVSKELYRI